MSKSQKAAPKKVAKIKATAKKASPAVKNKKTPAKGRGNKNTAPAPAIVEEAPFAVEIPAVEAPVTPVEIPAPAAEAVATVAAKPVKKESPAPVRYGLIKLTEQGARQYRAMLISKASHPLSIMRFLRGVKKEVLTMAESKVNTMRKIHEKDCVEHKRAIPIFVKSFGQRVEDVKACACVALGFKPSKTVFIESVQFATS